MITGAAAYILVVVMLSANKVGYEIRQLGLFMNEEACHYELEDQLVKKSTFLAECVKVEQE